MKSFLRKNIRRGEIRLRESIRRGDIFREYSHVLGISNPIEPIS